MSYLQKCECDKSQNRAQNVFTIHVVRAQLDFSSLLVHGSVFGGLDAGVLELDLMAAGLCCV
jgi:hypothetical protein